MQETHPAILEDSEGIPITDPPIIRVLLADDEEDVLEDLHDLLVYQKTLLYTLDVVAMASNGKEAVEMAALSQPDIAILDLEMPGLNGIEAAKAMHQHPTPPKILLYSAHHDRVNMYEALEAHVRGYVLKSRNTAFFSALDEVLNDGLWFDPLVFHEMYGKSIKGEGSHWLSTLSAREKDVLDCFRAGKTQTHIATELNITMDTVKSHLSHIRKKAGCKTLTELKLKLMRVQPPSE